MRKAIFGTRGYDKAIKILLLGVAGDTAKVKLPDSAGGNTYTSSHKEIPDGWMTGFTIYEFTVKDKRDCVRDKDKTYKFTGDDDNITIYKVCESGGRGLFKNVDEVL